MAKAVLTRPLRQGPSYAKESTQLNKSSGNRGDVIPLYRGGNITPHLSQRQQEEKKAKASVSLDSVLELVEQLSSTEKKQLLAKLALQAQINGKGDGRDLDMWALAVYDALASSIGSGGGGVQGVASVKRVLSAPNAWGPVAGFMESTKLDQLTVTERQSVYAMLAKLAVKRARAVANHGNIPMSAKLVGTCSSNLAGLFDQAFPGYLASGLALLVAKQLVGSKSLL